MNQVYRKSGLAILAMSVSLSGWALGSSCMPIAQACMGEGYYKGGHDQGKGLVEDCVMPITEGTKTIPGKTFSADQLQQCKMMVAEKMKAQDKSM